MFICPHCGKETHDPKAALFDRVMMGRSTCEHCGNEFLIVEGVPVTESAYRDATKQKN